LQTLQVTLRDDPDPLVRAEASKVAVEIANTKSDEAPRLADDL
jgi:hypothetical protein